MSPPATAPTPAPVSAATSGPAISTGPTPGMASPARLATSPATPPVTPPITAPVPAPSAAVSPEVDVLVPVRAALRALSLATMLIMLRSKPDRSSSRTVASASEKWSNSPTIVFIGATPFAPGVRWRREWRNQCRWMPAGKLTRRGTSRHCNSRTPAVRSGRDSINFHVLTPQRHRLRLVRLASTPGDPHFLLQHQPLLDHNDLFHDRDDPRVPLLPRLGGRVHHAVHRHALDHHVLRYGRLIDHLPPLAD